MNALHTACAHSQSLFPLSLSGSVATRCKDGASISLSVLRELLARLGPFFLKLTQLNGDFGSLARGYFTSVVSNSLDRVGTVSQDSDNFAGAC